MAAKNRADIQTEIDSLLADNVTGDIAPSDVRTVHGTSKDSNLNLLEAVLQTVAGATNFTGGLQVAGAKVLPIGNRVVVNDESNFPAAVSDVRTLAANTEYFLGDSNVDVGDDRFVLGANTVISGGSIGLARLTSTTTGDLFTGTDVGAFTLKNCDVVADSASIFNITDATPSVSILALINTRILQSASLGTVTDLLSVNFSNSGAFDSDQGLTFAGNNIIISIRQMFLGSTSASFKALDLAAGISPTIEFNDLIVNAPSGAIGISGLASSGNVTSGSIATVNSCEFLGGVTPLENITANDIRWSFQGNSGIPDTNPDALLSLTGNATETVIAASSSDGSSAVLLAGTWVVERTSHFTGTTAGRATYNGERDLAVPVDIKVTVKSASGTNKDIAMYLAVGGSVVASARDTGRVGATDPRTLIVPWQIDFSVTNYVEIFLENQSDTVNLIATDAILRVR